MVTFKKGDSKNRKFQKSFALITNNKFRDSVSKNEKIGIFHFLTHETFF